MAVDLEYTIWLDDKDLVAENQAAAALRFTPVNQPILIAGTWSRITSGLLSLFYRRGKVYAGPERAAGYPWHNETGLISVLPLLSTGQAFQTNSITSPWIASSGQTTNPTNVDQFERRKSGFWGWLFGLTETYRWVGRFEYAPPKPVVVPGTTSTPVAAISERKWIEGFEFPVEGAKGTGLANQLFTRAASRHTDGMGIAFRSQAGAAMTHACAEHGAAASPKTWERFYIRVRGRPTAAVPFWNCQGSVSASSGVTLQLESSGRISAHDTTAAGVMTQLGITDVLDSDKWYRLDLVFSYATGINGAGARFELWLNGQLVLNIMSVDNTGLGIQQDHLQSRIGNSGGYETRNLGLDVDDWMGAVPPSWTVAERTGNDWINGSRMAAVRPDGFSDAGDYTGDWRFLLQQPALDALIDGQFLETTTSGDVLAVATDAELSIERALGSIGCVGFVVGVYSQRDGTGNGETGFAIAGAAPTMTANVDSTIAKWNTAAYRPSGALTPPAVTPLVLYHEKAATTDPDEIYTIGATAELIGKFGAEDIVPSAAGAQPSVVGSTGIHNAPYPRTAWAQASDIPPIGPVAIIAGTYSGNDTGQDLAFQFPPTWLFIRRIDAGAGVQGTFWFSSMKSAHNHLAQAGARLGAAQVLIDPAFEVVMGSVDDQMEQYLVRIAGDDVAVNASGEDYAYVAFCDPGMRFQLNGAVAWPKGAVDRTTNLFRTNFRADAAMVQEEITGGTTSGSDLWYKGPGHATNAASKTDAAETATALALNRGNIVTKSALHAFAGDALAFSLWRKNDGSGDAGMPKVVQIFSYVGDGVSPRNIPFGTAAGVRPLWAMVVPHDAAAVYRDHEHQGTGSTQLPATNVAANGIRGGDIDTLIVGSDLNANGVTYDVFILPGGTSSCNGGFSCAGTFVPVPPDPVPGWNGCDPITISPTTLAAGRVDVAYSRQLSAIGGIEPYTWSVVGGSLPAGLSLSGGGLLSGTPTSNATVSFLVRATDAGVDGCFGEQFYTISFNADDCPDIVLSPEELPEATVGVPYTASITATGGDGPYEFTVSEGALPEGFELSETGVLSGTLVSTDVDPFTIRAIDINECFGETLYSLVPDEVGGGVSCVAGSLAIVNRALARIGITKPIVNMTTDQTVEAVTARLHYTNAVDTVLRDFAWPFATKYAALVKVGGSVGSPVNADWTFSYRQPNGCLFERRIVTSRGAAVDPTPAPFQLSSDLAGGLIFCNVDNAVLEFTSRPSCPALRGDPLFRDALTWKLAAEFAPALTRMADVQTKAENEYRLAIQLATLVLKPGVPGATPAAAVIDTAAASKTANTAVVNRALVRIGATTIAALDSDQTPAAVAARAIFEDELQSVLRDFPWAFATSYVTPVLVDGEDVDPVNADWTYSYRLAADVVAVRRLVTDKKRGYEPNPGQFRLAQDATGKLLYVNDVDPVVEVTTRLDGAVAKADALFRDALAWRLAASLAPTLATRDPEKPEQEGRGPVDPQKKVTEGREPKRLTAGQRIGIARWAWDQYQACLIKARVADANEQQPPLDPGDADWIRARN